MWVLAPQLWEDLLTEYGFRVEAIDLLPHPDNSATVIQQLIRARRVPDRPARVSSRPRSTRAPKAHAAVGVGAILLSEEGILLGLHRRGTLELPGGNVAAGESFEDAVNREPTEETGLVARAKDVGLLGTLVDHVAGVLRVTVGALVHDADVAACRPQVAQAGLHDIADGVRPHRQAPVLRPAHPGHPARGAADHHRQHPHSLQTAYATSCCGPTPADARSPR
ncbi:NUDIX domain-containing protein [Streptomyces canus]|uniref:NUDIX domain-containing protein n=1 Tax=Streptomyces canus TaxID=58343 RepID=UPI003CF632DB